MAQWEAPESFAEYVRDRHRELLRFATALTGSRSAADDLVQDALERVGLRWHRIASDDPEGYVRRIIINRHLNLLRFRRRERLVPDPPERPVAAPTEQPDLRAVLALLPRRQRTAVVLRYYLDHSDVEIAALMGISASAVRSNLSRALARLRPLVVDAVEQQGVGHVVR